jgi:hypothetical protein
MHSRKSEFILCYNRANYTWIGGLYTSFGVFSPRKSTPMPIAHRIRLSLPFTTTAPARNFAAYGYYHLLHDTYQVRQCWTARVQAMTQPMLGVP